ncbi:hypothetical protein ACFWNN_34680 [Lentzea sp. NPDC058450]|uniref:hypothetical protein n=1 Tax=Lentzea sp. NPDC058450 TaxID=3346505 RepID=UPI00365069D0
MPTRPSILYVSNLAYPAKGRRYCDEDIYLTSTLRQHFDIAITHPEDAATLMDNFDTVVVRNSGPVIDYPTAYETFRTKATTTGHRVYNPLTGKADMAGKQYMLDLTTEGYPVIPTIDDLTNLHLLTDLADRHNLPTPTTYVTKPKAGADSHGLEFHTRETLENREAFRRTREATHPQDATRNPADKPTDDPTNDRTNEPSESAAEATRETTERIPGSPLQNPDATERIPGDTLIQPKIDFRYEVSFYFVDQDFQYALHAPDPAQRWELTLYTPSDEDLEFAQKFIAWNDLPHGIQRVDACRTQTDDLLLVELEDLNPYLSLDRTTDDIRTRFAEAMTTSLRNSLDS